MEACAEEVVGLVGRLDKGDRIRLEGEAGKACAEVFGLRVLPGGIDEAVLRLGVLRLDIMELLALQGLDKGGFAGLAPAHEK